MVASSLYSNCKVPVTTFATFSVRNVFGNKLIKMNTTVEANLFLVYYENQIDEKNVLLLRS